jgi:hypothetical protein
MPIDCAQQNDLTLDERSIQKSTLPSGKESNWILRKEILYRKALAFDLQREKVMPISKLELGAMSFIGWVVASPLGWIFALRLFLAWLFAFAVAALATLALTG